MRIKNFTFDLEPDIIEMELWFAENPSYQIRFIVRYAQGVMIFYE